MAILLYQEAITKEGQVIRIPKDLAERLRRIAPYGEYASMDSFVSSILEDVVSQLDKNDWRAKQNRPSEAELKQIREEIKCYSLYC